MGTLIGGVIILNGHLINGANGFAGEFGHGGYFQNDFACTCGLKYCLEAVSSTTGFNKVIRNFIKNNPDSFIVKLKNNNEVSTTELKTLLQYPEDSNQYQEAKTIINYAIDPLTNHMSTMIYALNPQIIILAGGLTLLGVNFKVN